MSKYHEFQQLLVNDGQRYRTDADQCFDAIDDLTRQLIDYSGWCSEDVEYITLPQPVTDSKPSTVLRFDRVGHNRERVREVARLINGWWCLGIRFRLKPHTRVAFQPSEVLFVLPLLIQKTGVSDRALLLKITPAEREFSPDELDALTRLVFQRMQSILEAGIQHRLSQPETQAVLQGLGFVLSAADRP